jgi:hypothetical protein
MTTALPPTVISVAQEVAAPSPKVTGGVLTAPLGTTLPTDSVSPLDPAFITLGRVSDAGVDKTEERPNTEVNDWGGDLIAVLQDKYGITVKFKLLQLMNADVQSAAHGADNVSVTPATSTTGTTIEAKLNAQLLPYQSWCIDAYYMLMTMRLVVPNGRITTIGALKWVHKELAAFDLTLKPFPDQYNNHAYEYWNDGITLSS